MSYPLTRLTIAPHAPRATRARRCRKRPEAWATRRRHVVACEPQQPTQRNAAPGPRARVCFSSRPASLEYGPL